TRKKRSRSLSETEVQRPSSDIVHLETSSSQDAILHTLTKAERKKGFSTTTMKPMSAHDEKNLNTAIALANEITSKSMNDLEDRHPQSPSERKFNFRFGRSGHHSTQTHEPEREHSAGYGPRRNFSDEAKSVPDLASTITAESKLAYASLIEEPTPSTSLMTQIAKETGGILKSATIPKPTRTAMVQYNNRTVGSPHNTRSPICSPIVAERPVVENTYNILPLPPRTTKPKLVDKPRHVRKYPLKLVDEPKQPPTVPPTMTINIYQNTKSPSKDTVKPSEVQPKSEDVVDTAKDTNPFLSAPGPSNANPFGTFLDNDHDDDDIELELNVESDTDSEEETHTKLAKGTLSESKDHVSVEDLLEFADQKPCGRQRGVESDEVRIMSKVLKDEVNEIPLPPRNAHLTEKKPERPLQPKPRLPGADEHLPKAKENPSDTAVAGPSGYQLYPDELPDEEEDEIFSMVCASQCLLALELCGWDVSDAFKLMKTKMTSNRHVSRNRFRTIKKIFWHRH
ncbi:hypothetical protein HF086_004493, partial [Spodoptera exigua]